MIKLTIYTALVAIGFIYTPIVMADKFYDRGFYDTAKVVHVEPVIRLVQYQRPHENCYWRETSQPSHKSYTRLISGGIIGGLVGHQFGKGHGKEVMTVAGTLLGASIGNDLSTHRYTRRPISRKVCEVNYSNRTREEVNGYRVTYRYHGKTFERQMDYRPGRKLRVRVDVIPVDEY